MHTTTLEEKIFGEYEVNFPLEESLSILIGENGSGKTKILEALSHHFKKEGKKVIYLPDSRTFSFSDKDAYWLIFEEETANKEKSLFRKYDIQSDMLDIVNTEGQPIYSGKVQLANIFCLLQQHRNEQIIVIIDELEKNIHLSHQRSLITDMLKYDNIEKLIVSTHSPDVVEHWFENCVQSTRCVQLY